MRAAWSEVVVLWLSECCSVVLWEGTKCATRPVLQVVSISSVLDAACRLPGFVFSITVSGCIRVDGAVVSNCEFDFVVVICWR